jgi:TonB family protein
MTDTPEQNGGSSPTSVPVKDRRLHARQRASSLTYVDLGENNGGIVLNVSEAGIRIQAAAPLEEGPVSLRLQLPGTRKRLEVNAEVVWVGPSRKEAGLHFVDLSEDARKQIRKWIAREESPDAVAEEEESEAVAESSRVDSVITEQAAVEASSADFDEVIDDEGFLSEDEPAEEHEPAAEYREITGEESAEELAAEEQAAEEEVVEASQEAPEEIAELEAPVENRAAAQEAAPVQIPEARKAAEPESVVVEARNPVSADIPELQVSTFDGISGTHGAPSLGFPSPARIAPRPSPSGGDAPLFVRPHRPVQVPDDDGWKSYRVKPQSGWLVAALVLLLALISFVAGMAVRRGALNSVIGQTDEPAHPQSAPPAAKTPPGAPSANAPVEQPSAASPLEIEIVDSSGRRWEVPAAAGSNQQDASAARESPTSEAVTAPPSETVPARKTSGSQSAAQDRSPAPANAEKAGTPLMLTLPETPISASGSVAIRSRSVVPVPPGAAQSAQEGRNLQIGQLTNLVEPVYPPDAQKRGIEGTVKLHAVVGVDGTIQSLEPRSGPAPLIQAAMTAVREWKYNPTTLNGKPIETQEDLSFAFRLPR